jgi:serine protease Do
MPVRGPWIAIAVLAAAPFVAGGDGLPDKGKKLLPRLFESAAAAAADATVRIQADKKDVALGTVVSADGYILTKGSELIGKEGKPKAGLVCTLKDGSTFDAAVVGYHQPSDLMLLKVDAEVLSPVKFAPPKVIEAGNFVAVTGYTPSNNGDPDYYGPVAVGVVSTVGRPMYQQESVVENANRGFLGILFEMSRDPKNTRIEEVKNRDAFKSGLRKGDAIVGLNDRPVESRQDLFDIMNDTRPEETISLKIKRKEKEDEKELTFKFKLIKNADMDRGAMQNGMGGGLSDRRGGFPKVIQHETVINPAQCGGPLVDLDGHVIGLNIARAGRVETWALPEDVITPVLKELKDGKYPLKTRVQIKSEKAPEKKADDKKEATDKK